MAPSPLHSPSDTVFNRRRVKMESPFNKTPNKTSRHAQRGLSDQENHRPTFDQTPTKEEILQEAYRQAQRSQEAQREREKEMSRLALRQNELIREQEELRFQQQKQQKQQKHLQFSQSPRKVKQEAAVGGAIAAFQLKIKDRFPGRPQLVQQFLSMMESDTPTSDLLPEVATLFRTARELVQDFKGSMDAIDENRTQQPQPDQALLALPSSSTHPPDLNGINGHLNYKIGDAGSQYQQAISAHMRELELKERKAIQHLLSLPDIDIAPEQRKGTPNAMSCTLMDHQKVCLTWLTEQEKDPNKRGGLLADTMGLGKTVQALALILARPSEDPYKKTTLIVAPLSLLKQWEREIATKVKARYRLKTLLYHGQAKRGMTVAKLLSHDVVLTTYGTISSEFRFLGSKKPIILGGNTIFHRAILDEAHNIKNRSAKSSLAASKIKATYRLCMTGTPFMNRAQEIFPLIRFLRIRPYDDWEKFKRDINKPIEKWSGNARDVAIRKLQALFRSITLRRTKTSTLDGKPILRLPELVKEDAMASFNEEQQAFYTALEERQRLQVNKFLKAGTVMKQYTYILVLLLRLRQACCHPHLIRDFGIPEGIQLSSNDMCKLASKLHRKVVQRLKAQDEFECPLCNEMTKSPLIISPCGHPICSNCFSALTEEKAADSEFEIACPHDGCDEMANSEKVICHCFFVEVHMPEKLEPDSSADDDSEDDSDGFESLDDDGEDLKGFIVSDEEEEYDDDSDSDSDRDASEASEGSEDSKDSKNSEASKISKASVKSEGLKDSGNFKNSEVSEADDDDPEDTKHRERSLSMDKVWDDVAQKKESPDQKPVEDSDNDSLASLEEIWRQVEAMKSIGKDKPVQSNKRKTTPDSLSDLGAKEKKMASSKGKRKRSNEKASTRSMKKRKTSNIASRRPRNGKKKFMSLAALKKASSSNPAAKAKYLKRLRKDWVPSAKTDKTMEILCAIRENNPKEKTLVFSLWTSFLDILEIPIHDQGFQYSRYDGTMSHGDRDEAVKNFMNTPEVQILLVSLSAGNAGLNLTAATNVLILEPFWNPFVEEQAIDRTHRIGQKNEVKVYRVLIEGTVEDRIRALQEKKRELVNAALSEEGAQGVGRLTISELRGLFGFR
ncbi:SNF2 family N-terminal domain-containing protein [Jackrogersella minutella]|nr:SNF2 family N-terminal domain-containing protein [Jackrogersella minutella]